MIGPHHAALGLAAIRVLLTTIFILILTLAAPASEARAMRGVALIIGNSAYQHLTPLTNPEADADAIEKLFDELGFETYDATDADLKKLRRTIDRFIEDAEGVDVALVYYAGHGVEAGGENYLVPVDADVSSLDDATEKLVPLSGIMSRLREVAPLSFVLLDACRDNPFPPGATIRTVPGAEPLAVAASGLGETRTMGKFGKAAVEGKTAAANDSIGTLIGFAAEPGQRALDGEPGGNSPYAAAVLRHVPAMAGEEISTVMRMVAEEVYLKTGGRQRPWVNENLRRLVYLGATPPEVEGAQGDILRERRQLLINIASLPSPERKAIEAVAREGGVSMDAVYAMLKRLGQDAPQDPVQLERLLQDQLAKLKELEAKVDAVESKDPEIARLSGLASQAMAEGAIDTALKIHEQAKERARDVSSNSLDDTEAALKERRMELAEVFASSARDNFAAFNYAQAAKDYEEAFSQVERWDDFSAWSYRGNQAVALMELGWKGGATDSLRKSAELARDIVVLSERLEDRANWALSQTFLGNTLATLGQRLNNQQMIADSIKAYEAALTVYAQDAYPKERRDVLQNLAGSTKQVAQRFEPARARVELAKAVKMFDELLANADRSQDGLGWASLGMSKGMTMIDLARIDADVPMLRDTIALLTDVAKEFEAGTSSQQSNALCNLANAWSELGIAAKQVKSLETADDYYGRCIPLTDKAITPVLYSDQLTARSLNYHNLYLQTDDAAWLDRAVPLLREARDSLDPAALPIEWRSANTALAGALLSVGRARKDAKSLAEALELYAASQKFFDPAKEPDQWADNLSRLADTRRNIGEIVPAKATFDLMLDEHEQALHSISAEKFPAVVTEIRQRISWISTATSRLQDKLPEDEAIALLQRGAAILERPLSDGPLASVQSELGRRTYIKAVAKDDAGLRQAILLYRRSLVEGAKDPDYDSWRVTQSNLGLALVELARIEKDNKLLKEAVGPLEQAIASTADVKSAFIDRKRLAETLDKLGNEGDLTWLRRAAAAWDDASIHIPPDANADDRGYVYTGQAITLQNLSYFTPGGSDEAIDGAIAAYRRAIAARTRQDDLAAWQGNVRALAEMLRITGENRRDKSRLSDAIALYRDLDGPGRSGGPDLDTDRLAHAVALVALGRQGGNLPAFADAMTIFDATLGSNPAGVPAATDKYVISAYSEALRQTGYDRQQVDVIRRSVAVLDAYEAAQPTPLASADAESIAFNRAEGELFVGDLASDTAALAHAAALYGSIAAGEPAAANLPWQNYLKSRKALAHLVLGEITDNPDDWRAGLDLIRDTVAATSQADNPQAWAQNTGDLAVAIARSARVGVTGDAELSKAVEMARDSLTTYRKLLPDDVPTAQSALGTALIENGRATATRAQIEEGLALIREAIAAKQAKSQTWTIPRMQKNVAYAEGLLKKM